MCFDAQQRGSALTGVPNIAAFATVPTGFETKYLDYACSTLCSSIEIVNTQWLAVWQAVVTQVSTIPLPGTSRGPRCQPSPLPIHAFSGLRAYGAAFSIPNACRSPSSFCYYIWLTLSRFQRQNTIFPRISSFWANVHAIHFRMAHTIARTSTDSLMGKYLAYSVYVLFATTYQIPVHQYWHLLLIYSRGEAASFSRRRHAQASYIFLTWKYIISGGWLAPVREERICLLPFPTSIQKHLLTMCPGTWYGIRGTDYFVLELLFFSLIQQIDAVHSLSVQQYWLLSLIYSRRKAA